MNILLMQKNSDVGTINYLLIKAKDDKITGY
jgi:hypothetical protein